VDPAPKNISQLECAIIQIPKEWAVVCWLTEVLTTHLVSYARQNAPKYVISVFSKLIQALTGFYTHSQAPKLVKCTTLKLLSRTIKKLRVLYSHTPSEHNYQAALHFQLQFVTPEFTKSLVNELADDMNQEKRNHNASHSSAGEGVILYSSFVQHGAEFLMNLVVPCYKDAKMASFLDLLNECIPEAEETWKEERKQLGGLIQFQYYLHFMQGEMNSLPDDMLKQIHKSAQITDDHLDNVIVIEKIPKSTGYDNID